MLRQLIYVERDVFLRLRVGLLEVVDLRLGEVLRFRRPLVLLLRLLDRSFFVLVLRFLVRLGDSPLLLFDLLLAIFNLPILDVRS